MRTTRTIHKVNRTPWTPTDEVLVLAKVRVANSNLIIRSKEAADQRPREGPLISFSAEAFYCRALLSVRKSSGLLVNEGLSSPIVLTVLLVESLHGERGGTRDLVAFQGVMTTLPTAVRSISERIASPACSSE